MAKSTGEKGQQSTKEKNAGFEQQGGDESMEKTGKGDGPEARAVKRTKAISINTTRKAVITAMREDSPD